MKAILLTSLFGIFLLSCTKEVEISVPVASSKVVIDAKIYGRDSVLAFLSTSQYYLTETATDFGRDTNYEVSLYRDDVFIESLRPVHGNPAYRNYFTSNHAPEIGGNYSIRASRENLKQARGSTIIPEKVAIHEVVWDTTELGVIIMEVTFEDPPTSSDSYLVTSSVSNGSGFQQNVIFRTLDPQLRSFQYSALLQVENEEQFSTRFFISDYLFDGAKKTLRLELLRFQSDRWPKDIEGIEVKLLHISSDWYRHEESKFNFYKTSLGAFAEPSRVYSNVHDGFGVVASVTENLYYLKF